MSKAATIRQLKRVIKSMDYYLINYIKPYQEEVHQKIIEDMRHLMVSGAFSNDETSFEYLKADLEDCIRTVKKLKVR